MRWRDEEQFLKPGDLDENYNSTEVIQVRSDKGLDRNGKKWEAVRGTEMEKSVIG